MQIIISLILASVVLSCDIQPVSPAEGSVIQLYEPLTVSWTYSGCSKKIDTVITKIGTFEKPVSNGEIIYLTDNSLIGEQVIRFVQPNSQDNVILGNARSEKNPHPEFVYVVNAIENSDEDVDLETVNVTIAQSPCQDKTKSTCPTKCVWNGYDCIPKFVNDNCNTTYGKYIDQQKTVIELYTTQLTAFSKQLDSERSVYISVLAGVATLLIAICMVFIYQCNMKVKEVAQLKKRLNADAEVKPVLTANNELQEIKTTETTTPITTTTTTVTVVPAMTPPTIIVPVIQPTLNTN